MANLPQSTTNEKLIEAALRFFTPFVRLLIARGVTFQIASELLKQAYVDSANKHFVGTEAATGTRLSLLTGLNRKEIRRFTENQTTIRVVPMSSYATAVYAIWRGHKRWLDEKGDPRVLPKRESETHLSFDDLVRSVTTDHRPSAVLEEMVRLGFVRELSDGTLELCGPALLIEKRFDEGVELLTQSLEDHISASVTNVLEEKPRFLERMVFSDELSELSAEELNAVAKQHWQKIQDEIIQKSIAAEERDRKSGADTKTRIRVGMYFYSETEKNE